MNRLLFLLPVLFMACGTQLKTANGALQQAAEEEPPAVMPANEELAEEKQSAAEKQPAGETARIAVDTKKPVDLTQESYEEVLDDVKAFVDNLNMIIKDKNYYRWRSVLSEELFNEISSRDFLANASKWPSMKSRGIVLRELRDYFNYVVVPSRANSQVDKIEVVDNNRVKAFYENTRKERTELVYELAKTGDSWTIIR
ncbi:MAG: hypothetical protein LBC52_01330 [Treponema sp.]|nr:hypothetical protein [Treponema sp.]